MGLYTLWKLEYHCTVPGGPYSRPICTEHDFQARWKEVVAPVKLDPPVATVLHKATGISWPFTSWVTGVHMPPSGLHVQRGDMECPNQDLGG